MNTKIVINAYPESSFSIKVVFGLEICRVKNTRKNVPTISLRISRRHSENESSGTSGPMLMSLIICERSNAIVAPSNCAVRQTGSSFHLYLLSFLKQLERVMAGLKLAPLMGAAMIMATNRAAVTGISNYTLEGKQLSPQVKMIMPRVQYMKTCLRGAWFILLQIPKFTFSRMDSFREEVCQISFGSVDPINVLFIYGILYLQKLSSIITKLKNRGIIKFYSRVKCFVFNILIYVLFMTEEATVEKIVDSCVFKRTTKFLVKSSSSQEEQWRKKNQLTHSQLEQYYRITNGQPDFVPVRLKIHQADVNLTLEENKIAIKIKRKKYYKAQQIPREHRKAVIEELQSLFWCMIEK